MQENYLTPSATTADRVENIRQLSQKCFADLTEALAEAELIAIARRI